MAKHSPHIIKGAPYIPFELYEEHLARKDAALRMAAKWFEQFATHPQQLGIMRMACPARIPGQEDRCLCGLNEALAACRAELENK